MWMSERKTLPCFSQDYVTLVLLLVDIFVTV